MNAILRQQPHSFILADYTGVVTWGSKKTDTQPDAGPLWTRRLELRRDLKNNTAAAATG